MKFKIIIWTIVLFLLASIVNAAPSDIQFGDNYTKTESVIMYCGFNQSDSTTIQACLTGQTVSEKQGDEEVEGNRLKTSAAGNQEVCINVPELAGGAVASTWTADIITSGPAALGHNERYEFRNAADCGGTNLINVGSWVFGDANNDKLVMRYNNGASLFIFDPVYYFPASYQDTTVLLRVHFYRDTDKVNATAYNMSVTDGVITLTYLTESGLQDAAGIDDIASINMYGGDSIAMYLNEYIIYNGTAREATTPPAPAVDAFVVEVLDDYDGSTINNFTITLTNETESYINFSTTGDISFGNITNSGIYNITINSTENGGYFNSTYSNVNTTYDFIANITQSYLALYVNNSVSKEPLGSFTVYTNYSTHQGTNGFILLPTRQGHHAFNITSGQYPLFQYSYDIVPQQNLSFYANISPIFNFYLRREKDNTEFDIVKTNYTKLTVYCPGNNLIVTFRNDTYNSTQENLTVNCDYTLMKMDVGYSDTTYFRSLIPPTNQQNVTWYLLDLEQDTGVQIILELVDLTGDWTDGYLKLKTAIGANNEDIIEQEFDISNAVTTYLLKDALYTVSILDNTRTIERQLGTLVADAAGTKTITFPNIPFYPEESYLEDSIQWTYTFNTTSQILRFQYEDSSSNTTYIRWRVYNGSNQTHLLQTFESYIVQSATYTYQPALANHTYYSQLYIENDLLNFNITQYRTFGEAKDIAVVSGWTGEEEANIKLWIAIIILVLVGMLFSAKHAGIGLTVVFFMTWLFKAWQWLPISNLWLGFIGVVAILGFIAEGLRRG